MRVDEFDYRLPVERIAQRPAERRDRSRLMVLDRDSGRVDHSRFDRIVGWLDPGDLVVLNDTRVIPARLFGRKATGGRVEVLLVRKLDAAAPDREEWRCMIRGSARPGTRLVLGEGIDATVLEREEDSVRIRIDTDGEAVERKLERHGAMPLPPYIKRPSDPATGDDSAAEDRERYQTVFAREPGAVAAPTAGLHFTADTFAALERAGIERAFLTLHVGPGTFAPVRSQIVENHVMHEEHFAVGPAVVEAVARTRGRGGRVVAVGTTVTRALEWCAGPDGVLRAAEGECDLFIHPGYRFRVVDALVTNFHLPRSTLLMLVSAFAGRERVLAAYESAVEHGYRFYSYGDAMLLRSSR